MGGQIGDIGTIKSQNGVARVISTKKNMQGQIYHLVEVLDGIINKDDEIELIVNESRRRSICRNHTATHLLQSAFKTSFG